MAEDHAIPLWIPPLVGLAGQPVEHMVADQPAPRALEEPADQIPVSVPDHAAIRGKQPTERAREAVAAAIRARSELALGEYSARMLCAGCAAYLADLDSRAVPLLRPMIEGEARSYDPREQRLLAAWGARTAYAVLAVERRSQGVPKSHRRELRERMQPHPNVFVGFGRYRSNHIGVIAARLLVGLGESETNRDVEAYSVLAVFGHMALKVFGVRRVTAKTRVRSPQGQMIRFWPPRTDAASWPPLWGLTDRTLDRAFVAVPFYKPYRFTEVRYLGPGVKVPVRHKRVEGPGPRR